MYPKDVTRFISWSKAMVAGATVDKPNYGKSRASTTPSHKKRGRTRRRFRKRKTNAD